MLVPFGTKVVDQDGKAVGTVRRLVLHPGSEQVMGLVVHQGVLNWREVVVPTERVAGVGDTVRLALRAPEMDGLDLFHSENFRPMPDHWKMPMGFDERDLFLVGGNTWSEAALPFESTSPAVSGTPAYIRDPTDSPETSDPAIAAGMAVYDRDGRRVGDVESVEFDPASSRIIWIVVKRGHLFTKEVTIPASLVGSIADRVTLTADAAAVKRLESRR